MIAKLLGKNMRSASDAEIEDYLLTVAEKDPERIINLYTGDDSGLRLLFVEAKDKGVIYIKNKLYMFGEGTVLGPTDDAVITWMKTSKNASIVELIRRETNPDLYISSNPNISKKVSDEQPVTFDTASGDINPAEVREVNKVVELQDKPNSKNKK